MHHYFKTVAVLSVIPLSLVGCSTADLGPLVKLTAQPDGVQRSVPPSQQAAAKEFCRKVQFKAPLDVDTAYMRAMQTMGFRTTEERKRAARDSLGMIDDGFKHTAQPGSFYRMGDYATVKTSSGPKKLWATIELWKDGTQRTDVVLDYCIWGATHNRADSEGVEKAVKETLR